MTNAFTASALFGPLFCDPAVAGAFSADAFTGQMRGVETAWTKALIATGTVTQADGQAALAAIAAYQPADLGKASARDGVPVPGLVAGLRQGLPDGAAKAIHTGLTSQDVIDTAMVLSCLSVLDILQARLEGVIDQLDGLLARFGERPMMARTRMQAALPATAALRLSAWQRPLQDNLKRLALLRDGLAHVQIGGAIGLRDAAAAPVAAHAAKTLQLSLGPVWHSDRSRMADLGHWLSLLAGHLGKIGQDIALMAQQGVDEIGLATGGGSSAMPHKQNPVKAEALIALGRFVAAQQGLLLQAMVHEQERSGASWALEWLTLPAMAEATGAALTNADQLLAAVAWVGTPDT